MDRRASDVVDRAKLAHLLVRLGIVQPVEVFGTSVPPPPPPLLSASQVLGPRPTWMEWLGLKQRPVRAGTTAAATVPRTRASTANAAAVSDRKLDGSGAGTSSPPSHTGSRELEQHSEHSPSTSREAAPPQEAAATNQQQQGGSSSDEPPREFGEYLLAKRDQLQSADEVYHTSLLAIERARRQYLTTGIDENDDGSVPCVDEAEHVGKCYAYLQRERESTKAAPSLMQSFLRCAPYVERLEKCATDLALRHASVL